MRITRLSYKDHKSGWELQPMSFGPLNLLVGASGVGKSQVLQVLADIRTVVEGTMLAAVDREWELGFTLDDHDYVWHARILPEPDEDETDLFEPISAAYFADETLTRDGEDLASRGADGWCRLAGEEGWEAEPDEPLITAMADHEQYGSFYRGILSFRDPRITGWGWMDLQDGGLMDSIEADDARDPEHEPLVRLGIAWYKDREAFDAVVEDFREVFPLVQELRVDPESLAKAGISLDEPQVMVRERGVKDWVSENQISAGMHKVLCVLSDMHLSPKGSLILLDELDNGLGINCMGPMLDLILDCGRDLQFIITSHHPYIINNIPLADWRLLTREGSVVSAHEAGEFRLGESHHDPFIQLINLDAYQTGQTEAGGV